MVVHFLYVFRLMHWLNSKTHRWTLCCLFIPRSVPPPITIWNCHWTADLGPCPTQNVLCHWMNSDVTESNKNIPTIMSVIFLVVLMKFRISFGKGFIFYGFQVAFKCCQEKYQLICRWCKTPNNKFSVLWFGHIQCLTEPRNGKTIFFF